MGSLENIMYLTNGYELLALFNDIEASGYRNVVMLSDTKVGFSVQRSYPSDIRYKPAKYPDGSDDNIAVIWVVYESMAEKSNQNLIPIRLRIATMSSYRAKNWDYDFEDLENCPSSASVKESLESPQPLELNLVGEYFYSTMLEAIVNRKGDQTSGLTILNRLFDAHCDTVHLLKGIKPRTIYSTHKFIRSSLDRTVDGFAWFLTKVLGRQLDERPERMTYFHGYLPEDCKKLEVESIVVAGYRAPKPIVVIFVLLVVAMCYLSFPVPNNTYLSNLISSDYLLIIHSLLLLVILDLLLPKLIFRLLNLTIIIRRLYLEKLLKTSGNI